VKKWPQWAQRITEAVGLETVKYWHPTGWVNQNWLTHVIFYWLSHLSPFADAESYSFNTLVYWKFVIYIITIVCVYYTGRLLCGNPALSAVFGCFALVAGRSFLDIRPAGFSNLLVAVFLLVLALATYRHILYIWLIIPVTVFWCNVHGGYIYVFIVLVPFVALNFLTSFSKKRFVSIGRKGVWHTVAAGFAAFLAAIIFNPFHLTNMTHTFIISVSEHAKMWRTVNEWHPAFAWSNPVGTGFPFLVLFILSIGLTFLWFFSRFFVPKLLKAPKNELDRQTRLFRVLSTIFGCAAAVLICWVTFISFSFVQPNAADLFICAVFVGILLLSIYKSVHFIYFSLLLVLLALSSGDADAGYAGRYIYPFCILPAYSIVHILASLLSKTVKIRPRNILLVAATAIAGLLLMMVLFNPFKFDMSVWDIRQLFALKRLWRPKYEANLSLRYTHLFTVLYIINISSVTIFLMMQPLRKLFGQVDNRMEEESQVDSYQLPKIDLALMAVAALTIYMAYRSRRFIPIAAIAACPVIAMLIDQMTRTISAARSFHTRNSLTVSPMPYNLQVFFSLAGVAAIVFFGTWWGLKFKRVYLDEWPADPKLNSVFIRMTASHAKPFYAGKFIKDNRLEGKMLNYWTEGGFIAWAQEPDPDTGRTPLQLYMDGRAQAAYEPEVYQDWSNIMAGGPAVQIAKIRRQKLDYAKIGQWVGDQLRKRGVWAALMPLSDPKVYNGPFVKGIERNGDWQLAFFNNKQKLFVDRTAPQGKELLEGIFNGKTRYPDDFSRNLVIAHNMLFFGVGEDTKKRGLDFAIKAFESNPSQAPMRQIIFASKFAEMRPHINAFCKNYFDDFVKNKGLYAKEDGYLHRIWAVLIATDYLQKVARLEKNAELVEFYEAKKQQFNAEQAPLRRTKRW
ncbi:MAG: hypothetical protein ACYTE5_06635, partial [Planctomycetota bacterium]|jgi:hypothetical protein